MERSSYGLFKQKSFEPHFLFLSPDAPELRETIDFIKYIVESRKQSKKKKQELIN
jgi:hypothetical protein